MAVSNIAGNYAGGSSMRMTCILDEGAPTYAQRMNMDGTYEDGWTWATPTKEGEVISLSNDAANTFAATGGLMVVKRPANTEALIIGQIVSSPKLVVKPTKTDTDADSLAKRLAAKYYRVAEVEVWGFHKITKATVTTGAGAYHAVPGVAGTLNYKIATGIVAGSEGLQLVTAAANGVGIVPLTYVVDGGSTTFSCLVGITGFGYAVS